MSSSLVRTVAAWIAGLCLLVACGHAQQPATPAVPTTRILAIGTLVPGADPAAVGAILPVEVRETLKLYLEGRIDQWFSLQAQPGVVFVLDLDDPAAAREMLEKLPLGQAHLMRFELMPLGPLKPLALLQGLPAPAPAR